jgi:hypothetical protein
MEASLNVGLNDSGYTIFNLLNKKQIEKLLLYYENINNKEHHRFFASTHLENKDLVREISKEICGVVTDAIQATLTNAQILGGAFVVKPIGMKGILPLHQDWNLVDEQIARSYNLWIPLVNVSSQNGAMKILPRSHKKEQTYRGFEIPSIFKNIEQYVDKEMITLNMKAGQGLLYDHALWHSSPENYSPLDRICIVIGISPVNVEFLQHKRVANTITTYRTTADYLLSDFGSTALDALPELSHGKKLPDPIDLKTFRKIYLHKEETYMNRVFKFLRFSDGR